ncbi:MAG: DegT/DnrJ/EryC1/StrS family aminotransferase [Bryobacteraceae bacterium]|nr:DegT/DnrJ/EryC1/StrS family aminotransferase [Bryobacteraceae bacterium]
MSETAAAPIPLLDLRAQYASIRSEVEDAVRRVLESQQCILGPDVAALEEEIAAYCGVKHAIGCGSGTDALLLALRALDIGPGDEVLTTPFTFFATAGAIANVGATPVFADIDPLTFNLDPGSALAALKRRPRIRAILPVHLYGLCADMDPFLAMAAERGIPVIEDAAQAIGAEYRGRRAGSIGTIGCFSFFPTKNLGGAGEGGILTTNDGRLADRLRALRVHGSRVRYYHDEVGTNSRLDTLQAAILRVKLRRLEQWTALRIAHAQLYTATLVRLGAPVAPPAAPPYPARHVYHQYVIRAPRRDALRAWLAGQGIASEIYYPLPLHRQNCFLRLGYPEGSLPASEQASREVLALPIYPELEPAQIERVCHAIGAFYQSGA